MVSRGLASNIPAVEQTFGVLTKVVHVSDNTIITSLLSGDRLLSRHQSGEVVMQTVPRWTLERTNEPESCKTFQQTRSDTFEMPAG